MDLIENFKEYINNIKESDNLAVFYHAFCTDGLCSCVLTSKAITKIKGFKPKYHIHHLKYEIDDNTINFLKNKKIKKAIFVDLSLTARLDKIKEAEEFAEILIIDHHKFDKIPDSN